MIVIDQDNKERRPHIPSEPIPPYDDFFGKDTRRTEKSCQLELESYGGNVSGTSRLFGQCPCEICCVLQYIEGERFVVDDDDDDDVVVVVVVTVHKLCF